MLYCHFCQLFYNSELYLITLGILTENNFSLYFKEQINPQQPILVVQNCKRTSLYFNEGMLKTCVLSQKIWSKWIGH